MGAATVLTCGLLAVTTPCTAYATSAETEAEVEELAAKVEECTTAYDDAKAELAQIEEDMAATQERIDEVEALLPDQRAHAADSMRALYKMQQGTPGLVELILSAENFNDFITTVQYLDIVSSSNVDEVNELVALEEELDAKKAELAEQQAAAKEAAQEAEDALAAAQEARQEAQERAEAQAAAEAAEAQAAIEAAQAAKEAAEAEAEAQAAEAEEAAEEDSTKTAGTFTTESGNEAQIETPESSTPEVEEEDALSDRDAFVQKWAARIDAYLAGSTLAGYGTTFAEAAWDYGVDPRWSPAIACIESGKGANCFKSHNAWGWGSSSWGDWDTAIRSHVAGLASYYGYTISLSAAKKYCPPNYQYWYSAVLSQMNCI